MDYTTLKRLLYDMQPLFKLNNSLTPINKQITTLAEQYDTQITGYSLAIQDLQGRENVNVLLDDIQYGYVYKSEYVDSWHTKVSHKSASNTFKHLENDGLIYNDSSACLYISLAQGFNLFGARENSTNLHVAAHYLKALLRFYSAQKDVMYTYQYSRNLQGTSEEVKVFAQLFNVNVLVMNEEHKTRGLYCGKSGPDSQNIIVLFNNGGHWWGACTE